MLKVYERTAYGLGPTFIPGVRVTQLIEEVTVVELDGNIEYIVLAEDQDQLFPDPPKTFSMPYAEFLKDYTWEYIPYPKKELKC
jgi:hypothetical protein